MGFQSYLFPFVLGGLVVAGGGGYTIMNYLKKNELGDEIALKIEKKGDSNQQLTCEKWEDGYIWSNYLGEPKCKNLFESLQKKAGENNTKQLLIIESKNSKEVLEYLFSVKNGENSQNTQSQQGVTNGQGEKSLKISSMTCKSKENLISGKTVVFCS
ncbi:hypothetical protein MSUIS_00990 [Mycoplasma suis KI3806]|nr:hypothetical protein MSUIS_00990 [Mycoplasma suis KI3806]